MALDKQIHIFSIDTSAFYNEEEMKIHTRLNALYNYRKLLVFKKKKHKKKYSNKIWKENNKKLISIVNDEIKNTKDKLYVKFKENNQVRYLNRNYIYRKNKRTKIEDFNKKNIISVFESTLTRIMGVPINTLSTDLMVIQAYFFEIIEDIILNGFIFEGEKYVCLTASAGQIRTKKTVFIKEKILNKIYKTLTCGLTLDIINEKGGINVNKYLAYMALSNSATDLWEDFDINKTIVVDDMETLVKGTIDLIRDTDYSIERQNTSIPIPHMDGCGMILPSKSKKNFMCRLPWVKGLLISFPFDLFINENSKESYCGKIKDIYGIEHDILEEGIEIIFTKSQFKMWKYYSNWEEYKDNFNKYKCQAGKCNEEENKFNSAKINYQMLQTLVDIPKKNMTKLCEKTINDINNIGKDFRVMLKVLGVSTYGRNKNYLQQSLKLYPEMLQDTYCKQVIKQVKKSIVKQGRAGRININGTYTFLSPDLYAFCEWLFLKDENPKGLLKDGEVYCNIFKDYDELDCLRSPHLYLEHAIRKNIINEKNNKWFTTNAIYTSCHDLISKILMFDNDGDKSLVCAEKIIINSAKKHIKKYDIVPLYYNMRKAEPTIINPKSIYKGLMSAYKGGNIGLISNNITKIWNSDGNVVEKLEVIKLLCMENNFTIDFAKTLYKPKRPKDKHKLISKYTKAKLPHFFIYAKDKTKKQVAELGNSSMDRLEEIIPNPNIDFKKLPLNKFSYNQLMHNYKTEINENIIKKYRELDLKKPLVINKEKDEEKSNMAYLYQDIKKQLISISKEEYKKDKIENSTIEEYITDILIKYLYGIKHSKFKTTLWECFGKVMYNNLKQNLKGTIACENCGKRIKVSNKDYSRKYCDKCKKEIQLKWQRESMKKIRRIKNV